jgi:hypothetical protein
LQHTILHYTSLHYTTLQHNTTEIDQSIETTPTTNRLCTWWRTPPLGRPWWSTPPGTCRAF